MNITILNISSNISWFKSANLHFNLEKKRLEYLVNTISKIDPYKNIINSMEKLEVKAGLPHTRGNSGSFQVEEYLRETQGILIYFLNS